MPQDIAGVPYYTTSEIAEEMGCTVENVRRYIRSGALKAYRQGPRTFLIEASDYQNFKDEHNKIKPYERN